MDLRSEAQGQLLTEFRECYKCPPFERSYNPQSRYYRPNGSFPFQDAFLLYAMIRHLRPARLVEVGSDVNCIFFEILPRLKPQVIVHFHEIWYPFEYPKEWLWKGMFWNEAYLPRALLTLNGAFQIVLFNSFLNQCLTDRVKAEFPLFLEDPGASLWLRRAP